MKKENIKAISLTAGFTASIIYLVCLAWSIFLTLPALKITHIQILEIIFPGFVWMSFGGFLWGLVLSFLYGFLIARLYIFIYKLFSISDKEINISKKENIK
ncbi:MAG: DUF5676 family membrane protein [Patescibacteria group bacterium]